MDTRKAFYEFWNDFPDVRWSLAVYLFVLGVVIIAGFIDMFSLREAVILVAAWVGGVTFTASVKNFKEIWERDYNGGN